MPGEQIETEEYPIHYQIIDVLVQVMHKIAFIDKIPVDLGDGVILSAAEIHLIDTIGRFPGNSITELAEHLGVTKGAVSQMVQRLEMKGCLIRTHEPDNKKNLSLSLTKKGTLAYVWHKSLHDRTDAVILSGLADKNPQDLSNLLILLHDLSKALDLSVIIRESDENCFLKGEL
jgi:DNA-binding MarR family transcriptional regulator